MQGLGGTDALVIGFTSDREDIGLLGIKLYSALSALHPGIPNGANIPATILCSTRNFNPINSLLPGLRGTNPDCFRGLGEVRAVLACGLDFGLELRTIATHTPVQPGAGFQVNPGSLAFGLSCSVVSA